MFYFVCSNALAKVQQLSLQFHNVERDLVLSFRVVKRLYSRGFRIIHYEPNYHFPFKTGLADVFTLLLKKGSRCD